MRTSRRGSPIGWHTYEYRPGGRRPGRSTRLGVAWQLCAVAALLLAVGGVAYAQIDPATGGGAPPPGSRDSAWGPVTAADEDAVKKVTTANLWEGELGRMAAERGGSEAVRTAGRAMARDHNGRLREETIRIAARLRIPVPKRPTEFQRKITARLAAAADGDEFDFLFVNTLRSAHGLIFPALANIRASTRNELVQTFADVGMEIVGRHMSLLEDTGLVDEDAVDEPSQENVAKPLDPDDGGVGADPDDVEIPSEPGAGP
jgi:putative membrane protein